MEELKKKNEELREEISKLNEFLAPAKEIYSKNEELESKNKELNETVTNQYKNLNKKDTKIRQLEIALEKQLEDVETVELDDYNDADIGARRNELVTENNRLKSKLNNCETQRKNDIDNATTELRKQIRSKEEENQKLRQKNDLLEHNIKQKCEEENNKILTDLHNSVETLTAELKKQRGRNSKLSEENDKLLSKKSEVESKIEEMKKNANRTHAKDSRSTIRLTNRLRELDGENEKLRSDLETQSDLVAELIAAFRSRTRNLGTLAAKIDDALKIEEKGQSLGSMLQETSDEDSDEENGGGAHTSSASHSRATPARADVVALSALFMPEVRFRKSELKRMARVLGVSTSDLEGKKKRAVREMLTVRVMMMVDGMKRR